MNIKHGIGINLLARAKQGDGAAFFQIAMTMLKQNRLGFALSGFRLALKFGYETAKKYAEILSDSSKAVLERRNLILSTGKETD